MIRSGVHRHKAQTLPGRRQGRAKVHRRQRRVCVSKIHAGQPGAGAGGQEPRFPLLAETAHQAGLCQGSKGGGPDGTGAAAPPRPPPPQPKAAEKSRQAASFAARHWKGALIVGGVGLMLLLVMGGLQSCTAMFGSTGTALQPPPISPRTAICWGRKPPMALEADLQYELDNYESLHPRL